MMNLEGILLALKQDKMVARYAQEYMSAFLPGLYLLSLIDCHRRWLNSCKYILLSFIAITIGTIVHYFLCYHLVMNLRMGIKGVGISGAVMNLIIFVI